MEGYLKTGKLSSTAVKDDLKFSQAAESKKNALVPWIEK